MPCVLLYRQEVKMEKIYEQTLLYDFYGELLTKHQQSIYEDAVYNDMSLGEIAEEQGISRQGVHDLIKRCNKILEGYEEKLHLVEKFLSIKAKVQRMEELLEQEGAYERIEHIREIADEILEEL